MGDESGDMAASRQHVVGISRIYAGRAFKDEAKLTSLYLREFVTLLNIDHKPALSDSLLIVTQVVDD